MLKKGKDPDPDPQGLDTKLRIRIRIRSKMFRIRNTGENAWRYKCNPMLSTRAKNVKHLVDFTSGITEGGG
jgi:hypothetical protein